MGPLSLFSQGSPLKRELSDGLFLPTLTSSFVYTTVVTSEMGKNAASSGLAPGNKLDQIGTNDGTHLES